MNVIEEIKRLNFPSEKYVVFGGAALAARGLRETFDIDIVASDDLLAKCGAEGWKEHPRLKSGEKNGFHKGIIEIYPNVGGNFEANFADLRKNAEMIDGIPFCGLNDVIRIKRAYGRAKDLKDIELIENYLSNSKK